MNVITDADLAQARTAVEDLAIKLAGLRQALAASTDRIDGHTGAEIGRLMFQQEMAAGRLSVMEKRKELQDTARKVHSEAEKVAAAVVDSMATSLAASRERLLSAVEAAQTAGRELLQVAGEHDALVREAAAAMAEAGLPLVDGHGIEYETGSDAAKVRLRGAWWLPVEPQGLFLAACWAAARAELGDRADVTRRMLDRAALAGLERRGDGLLSTAAAEVEPGTGTTP